MRSSLIAVLGFVFCFLTVACNSVDKGPSDALAQSQVTEYLAALKSDEAGVAFAQLFRVDSVGIKDRLVEGRQASVIVSLTATVIAPPTPLFEPGVVSGKGSTTSESYRFLTSGGELKTGQVLKKDATFKFQRFDSGWKLQGVE